MRDLAFPLVNNWQAREIRTGADAREGLFQQVPNTVRWTDSIQHLADSGVLVSVDTSHAATMAAADTAGSRSQGSHARLNVSPLRMISWPGCRSTSRARSAAARSQCR